MLRFPFNSRPMSNEISSPPKQPVQEEQEVSMQTSTNSSLSPELNLLLSMVMKDGLQENKMHKMFEDILPYISGGDKNAIAGLLGQGNQNAPMQQRQSTGGSSLSEYSKQSRHQDLMNVMQQYAGSDTSGMMNEFQKNMEMQKNFEEMSKRMSKLSNTQNASPTDMMDMMSTFMPNQDMSQMKNMSNMMNMMKMMGGGNNKLKPEDMMKMMGGGNNNFKPEDMMKMMNMMNMNK